MLVACDACDLHRCPQPLPVSGAKIRGRIEHFRQQRPGNPEEGQQLVVPLLTMDIEQRRARGVGGIGLVGAPTSQIPEQPAVHSTEGKLASFRPLTGTVHMVEYPGNLGGGEIRVNQEAGAFHHPTFMAIGFEFGANRRCASILPDNRAVNWLSGFPIPDHRGFPLIGDADTCQG